MSDISNQYESQGIIERPPCTSPFKQLCMCMARAVNYSKTLWNPIVTFVERVLLSPLTKYVKELFECAPDEVESILGKSEWVDISEIFTMCYEVNQDVNLEPNRFQI